MRDHFTDDKKKSREDGNIGSNIWGQHSHLKDRRSDNTDLLSTQKKPDSYSKLLSRWLENIE